MSAELTRLEAGALSCVLDGADVRDLTVGGGRALTRLYIAVRDESWNTVPFACTRRHLETGPEHFKVELSCVVDEAPIRAEWEVTIAANALGEFRYAMHGRALSSFRYAKVGLNLHHPLPESLGARYVARRGAQTVTGRIPSLIEPQLLVDGKLTAMFMPYQELVLKSAADDEVVFRFAGDDFEMQDHRNWTDYNLKSYGTPFEVPLPQSAEPGQPIDQSVVVDFSRARGLSRPSVRAGVGPAERVSVDRARVAQLPRIGSEFPDEVDRLSDGVASLIDDLALDYVRLNLDLTSDDGPAAGAAKARQVGEWRRPLELVLVVSPGEARPAELARLGSWLDDLRPRLEHVVVLEAPRGYLIGRTTTPADKVRAYRGVIEERYGPVDLISATEQFFADLNRWWPDLAGVDGVGYTICPQVHAADDTSLMENSWGQADTVTTARARSGGRAVHVTSVAMIGKFGPYPGGVPDVAVLPAFGDQRQQASFGAAWTLSSLRQLVDAEAASATYFELAGARGLVPARTGSTGATAVPTPAYRVFESVLSWKSGNLVRVGTVHGAGLIGLGAEWPEQAELLVANLGPVERQVELTGMSGRVLELSELIEAGANRAAEWAEKVREGPGPEPSGGATFTIGRYGVTRVRTS